jgi:hypothetical protein
LNNENIIDSGLNTTRPVEDNVEEVNVQENTDLNEKSNETDGINILVRFVNENIRKIQVQPNDTIGLIKK